MEGAEYLSGPVERQTKIRRQGIRGVFQSTALLLILIFARIFKSSTNTLHLLQKCSPTSWWIVVYAEIRRTPGFVNMEMANFAALFILSVSR